MPLLRLAGLVASMPSWITLIINQDELELSPPPVRGSISNRPWATWWARLTKPSRTAEAPAGTTDDYLPMTNWKLLVKGNVVMDQPRHVVLVDTFNHLAHHRGQLTVYLRSTTSRCPRLYGPSADDQQLA